MHTELQAHPYWQSADWELVDGGNLLSPIDVNVGKRPVAPSKGENVVSLPRRLSNAFEMLGTGTAQYEDLSFKKVARSLGESQSIQRRLDLIEEGRLATDAKSEALSKQEDLMHVADWEFVSEHALAQEYLESAAFTM